MLITGHCILPFDSAAVADVRLAAATITVDDGTGRIIAIDEGRGIASNADLGDEFTIISPTFTDSHIHLPQFDSVGITGLELLDWLQKVIFPAEARWADADFAGQMASRVAAELLSVGTVNVAAYATVHPKAAQAAIDALAAEGIGGIVGQVLMDQEAPAELCLKAKEAIPATAALKGRGRIAPAVTPRFAVSCSRELMEQAAQLAAKNGQFIQTHFAETVRECARVRELHGLNYIEIYKRAGLLTGKTILAHAVHLSETDRVHLRTSGSIIAHCPTANRFLRAGTHDRAQASAAGIPVALGTDIAGGPDRSMIRVARAMIEAAELTADGRGTEAAGTRTSVPSAGCAWNAITAGNAAILDLGDTGSLHVGQRADLLVIDFGSHAHRAARAQAVLRSHDPLSALLFGWDERWLGRTVLNGRSVFQRG